jgi:hypothetical protein
VRSEPLLRNHAATQGQAHGNYYGASLVWAAGVDLPIGGYDCRAGGLSVNLSCLPPASQRGGMLSVSEIPTQSFSRHVLLLWRLFEACVAWFRI